MPALAPSSDTENEVAATDLMGRLARILRDLQETCMGLQDGLGDGLNSTYPLSSSLGSQLQEIDRVTQTMGELAAFMSALDTGQSDNELHILRALDQVRLHSVRERLEAPDAPDGDTPPTEDIELF
jgi:hypothetical protein